MLLVVIACAGCGKGVVRLTGKTRVGVGVEEGVPVKVGFGVGVNVCVGIGDGLGEAVGVDVTAIVIAATLVAEGVLIARLQAESSNKLAKHARG